MPVLELRGCTPEPLGNYLKGLGVFRLIAEQADPLTRAWWQDGFLWLHTKWSWDEIVSFFLCGIGEEKTPIYSPTPIFAPWGGRPGFYQDEKKKDENKSARERLAVIRKLNKAGRFLTAQHTVQTTDDVLRSRKWTHLSKEKRSKSKLDIIAAMRNAWGTSAVEWFDACLSLEENARFGFLYGTGGNEGSADITNNFWEMIEETIGLEDTGRDTRELLVASIAGESRVGGTNRTAGQHFPLSGDSANCGQTYSGSSSTNPWDMILMMEGAVLFAGATTKRLSQEGKGKAAFPFMIEHLATGESSTSMKDEAKQDKQIIRCRAEFWMPLWQSPTSLPGIKALLSEGRLQRLSGEQGEHTLHALEAIKTLGVSRGIGTFHRVALFERRGQGSYLAASLGFYSTSRSVESFAAQLAELDGFREQVYRNLREGPGMPDRIMRARQRFHATLATLFQQDEPSALSTEAMLEVMSGVSAIEREVALLKERERILSPCPPLSTSWFLDGGDGPEYGLARAIAGIAAWGESSSDGRTKPAVESVRTYLLPVARQGKWWVWSNTARTAVWARGASLEINLAAVLRRRLIDYQRGVGLGLPLWNSCGATFRDLLAYWHGEVNESRLVDLIYSLSLIDAGQWDERSISNRQNRDEPTPDLQTGAVWFDPDGQAQIRREPLDGKILDTRDMQAAFELPRIYHLLKLCFIGGRLPRRPVEGSTVWRSGDEPFPPMCLDVLTLVEAGHVSEAVQLVSRRLRAKGYPAVLREADMRALDLDSDQSRRLAGLLMIPVRQPGVLAALAIKPEAAN
ncbi:MAG: type I-U CRISPR-associated protein Csx17 [Acidobacteriales bacterium]|nr:type I-U CRISPR-associated protein Csx17 [Terriglobales bacterium]